MKKWKKILTSAFAAVMIFSLSAAPVFATESSAIPSGTDVIRGTETTYQVTLYSGNGEFKDKETVIGGISGITLTEGGNFTYSPDKITISGLKASEEFSFSVSAQDIVNVKTAQDTIINGVTVKGEQYYVKGFVPSGQSEESGLPTLTVTNKNICDVDYVIAYGIVGDQVSYTVKYQDKDGNALAKDDLFYGNVGEKPIVAYKRIEGYAPTVVAFTKTLSENVAENVFTFVYDKVPTEKVSEVVTEETEYNHVTVGGETIVIGGGTSAGTATNVTGGGTGNAGADAATDDAAGAGTGTEAPAVDESQIVDLDDEETPLANVEVDAEETAGSSTGVYVALGLLAVLIAAVVAYVASKKKKVQE